MRHQLALILTVGRANAFGADVRSALTVSRANNRAAGLTGCLMWTGGYFVQILEGMPAQLGKAQRAMAQDQRQLGMRVLIQEQAPARFFAQFPLAFVSSKVLEPLAREAYGRRPNSRAARDLMAALIDHFEEQVGMVSDLAPGQH